MSAIAAIEHNAGEVVRVRSSSWGELFDCAHRWEAKHILDMRSPSSFRAHLGTSIHASTAIYDQSLMDGSGITIDDAAGIFVDTLRNGDDVLPDESLSVRKAEEIGLLLHTGYCSTISPKYQYKAIELSPEPLLIEVPESAITIELTGTLDRSRIRADGAGISIADLKTGAQAVNPDGKAKIGHHYMQLGVYELLAEHSLAETITGPAEIIGLQTNQKARIGTACVARPRDLLIGSPDAPGLIQYAAMMLSSGNFLPNPSSQLCSEKYCVRWSVCKFHI